MKIIKVYPDGLGEAIGIRPGDRLLKINGKRVKDEIDYKFRITEQNINSLFSWETRKNSKSMLN